ncbi:MULTISPECIES: hypothetical protein [Moorena]|nr:MULTISPECIES: hypothetical protein [Moorena]
MIFFKHSAVSGQRSAVSLFYSKAVRTSSSVAIDPKLIADS